MQCYNKTCPTFFFPVREGVACHCPIGALACDNN